MIVLWTLKCDYNYVLIACIRLHSMLGVKIAVTSVYWKVVPVQEKGMFHLVVKC